MLANTALAGAPYECMKVLNKYTDLEVRCITMKNHYADGRVFPKDLVWSLDSVEGTKLINEADIVHIHNEPFHGDPNGIFLESKKILIQGHSVPVRPLFTARLMPCTTHAYTITQPMQEHTYALPSLPNLIDPDEFQPIERSNPKMRIVFAPTNRWKSHLPGSKAQAEVINILKGFESIAEVDIFSNLPYEENLKRKQQADVIIDDVVADTFHRTTLEGCCFGACVLTGAKGPWLKTSLVNLKATLHMLIKQPQVMKSVQKQCREWVTTVWNPKIQSQKYVEAYQKVMNDAR